VFQPPNLPVGKLYRFVLDEDKLGSKIEQLLVFDSAQEYKDLFSKEELHATKVYLNIKDPVMLLGFREAVVYAPTMRLVGFEVLSGEILGVVWVQKQYWNNGVSLERVNGDGSR